MTALASPAYRFATGAQWATGLSTGLAQDLEFDPDGGQDLGAIGAGETLLAVGPDGVVYTLRAGVLTADGLAGPHIGAVSRLIVGDDNAWALAPGDLVQLDRESLQPLAGYPAAGVVDIAARAGGGLWRLTASQIEAIDDCGNPAGAPLPIATPADQVAATTDTLALLRLAAGTVSLLAGGGWFDVDLKSLAGGAFQPRRISSDGASFLIAGAPGFLVLGPDGTLVLRGAWRNGREPAALVLAGDGVVAAFDEAGALRLRRFDLAAAEGGQVRLTPVLEPDNLGGGWLRAEVEARLPEGATLALRWAAIEDETLRLTIEATAADRSRPIGARLADIQNLLDPYWSPAFTYVGKPHDEPPLESFAFPLDAAAGPLLWIELSANSQRAAAKATIETLSVLHEAPSLMDHLPAIYRGGGDRDGTMRRLVGVLEATTQGIDAEIARLGERLDPKTTADGWLPSLAAMLGLPFDAALSPAMQRGLLKAARAMLMGRGTVQGVRALLDALFPERPVQVVDRTEQLVPLTLGGRGFEGGSLPMLLAGPTRRIPRLNARLVLGATRLCPASPCDDGLVAPPPEVMVTVPASYGERRRYGDAVRQMTEAVIPAGVRLRLRWSPWRAGQTASSPDTLSVIDEPTPLRVGSGQALGAARLGGRRRARIDRDGFSPVEFRLL